MLFIVVIICTLQLPGTFSTQFPIFDSYYEQRDEFGEVFSLYGLRLKLLNHTRYYRIRTCYKEHVPKYKEAVRTFVENLEKLSYLLEYEQSARPLQNLISTLKTYPTDLEELINLRQYDLAEKLVYYTTRRVIFFDIRYRILTDNQEAILTVQEYPENILNFIQQTKSNYLKLRENAKKAGWEITVDLLNCITTLIAYLIPVKELHPN